MEGQLTHVELRGVGRRFGGVAALRDVDLTIARGEVHALVGENGAGKSTLGRIIGGVIAASDGELLVDGRAVSYRHPHEALADGICAVAQELALVPSMSVIDNVFLGSESCRGGVLERRAMRRRYRELLELVGFALPADTPVAALSVAEQQKVEILRALARDAQLVVLDEPTAALSRPDADALLGMVRWLRERGTTVVYVSHHLDEILSVADRITVLKDGRLVRTTRAEDETPASLVTAMVGQELDLAFPPKRPPSPAAPVVLRAEQLVTDTGLRGVDLDLRAGEIVGIAGLVGSGRTELVRALFGIDRLRSGRVELAGEAVRLRSARDAMDHGLALVPESRREQGLLMGRSTTHNVTLAHLETVSQARILRRRREADVGHRAVEQFDIRGVRSGAPVSILSGGNQQKVLFAKWLLRRPAVFLVDEPTRGVDVGAKAAIHQLMVDAAAEGIAVLVVSSEIEEVIGLAHRVLVMRSGRLVAELVGEEIEEDRVMAAAFGTDSHETRSAA